MPLHYIGLQSLTEGQQNFRLIDLRINQLLKFSMSLIWKIKFYCSYHPDSCSCHFFVFEVFEYVIWSSERISICRIRMTEDKFEIFYQFRYDNKDKCNQNAIMQHMLTWFYNRLQPELYVARCCLLLLYLKYK